MNPPNEMLRGKLTEGSTFTNDEIAALKAQVQDVQLDIDILNETIDVLKKRLQHQPHFSTIKRRQ